MDSALLEEIELEAPRPAMPRRTFAQILDQLGGIPADRVRLDPLPGTATEEDAFQVNYKECLCELIDGTIVKRPMGVQEDFFGNILAHYLWEFVKSRKLGMVIGPRSMYRMSGGNLREPDVSFTSRQRLPSPFPAIGSWCPDLCVEVLSPSNTPKEMALKRRQYFASGCRLVWQFEPKKKIADVYTDAETKIRLAMTDSLDGGDVLPGFTLPLATLFSEFDDTLSMFEA